MKTFTPLLFLFLGLSAAGQISLLKDINHQFQDASNPQYITDVNGTAFLFMQDPNNGIELWKSDGTESGTVLVKDIYPGSISSTPSSSSQRLFAVANGLFFFAARHPVFGTDIWRSDGTTAGTFILQDINPGNLSIAPVEMVAFNNEVFFIHTSADFGQEIFHSDGTAAGTQVFMDIRPGPLSSSPRELTVMNNELYFRASDGVVGSELWKSDGTVTGTALLKDIYPGNLNSNSYPEDLIVVNDRIFFNAVNGGASGTGRELYVTDGTNAGTLLVADLTIGSGGSVFNGYQHGLGDTLYFSFDGDTTGQELWRSDGTAAGTYRMLDIRPGTLNSNPYEFISAGGKLFFQANDGISGSELYATDGTANGTTHIDINPGFSSSFIDNQVVFNGQLYFDANNGWRNLWHSDGTVGGTVELDVYPGNNENPESMAVVSGQLFLRMTNPTLGSELHVSDGTVAGTQVVDETPVLTDSSDPEQFVDINGITYFTANDGISGVELWRSDGTEAGTFMLKDILSGVGSSSPDQLVEFQGGLWFFANGGSTQGGKELWKSDGTAAGTQLFADLNPGSSSSQGRNLTVSSGKLFFEARIASMGFEPWVCDGTVAGTQMLKDINPGGGNSFVNSFTELNGFTYFFATDGNTGIELWKSDGTEAGTALVYDLNPGSSGSVSSPYDLIPVGNFLYFSAYADAAIGRELYRSDGTAGGTTLVADIRSGTGSSNPLNLTVYNDTLFFSAYAASGIGNELMKSDGTASGTVLVKDIAAGNSSSNINEFIVSGGTLYFDADDVIHGRELWKTNGTNSGTELVADINPGPGDSEPSDLLDDNGLLFFIAENFSDGRGVFASDGTEANTTRISILGIGDDASNLASAQGGFYFQGTGQTTAYEPYYLDRGASADLRVLLEGPYDANNALMKDDLRISGLIPSTEPFTALGFNMVSGGGETIDPSVLNLAGNDAIVDWVLIELRDANDPAVIILSTPALLQRDGAVVNLDGSSSPVLGASGSMAYLAIRHRNHFGVMSAAPINFDGTVVSLDFSDPSTATYGIAAQKDINGANALWSGNVFADGTLKYIGQDNDRDVILLEIGGSSPTNTVDSYSSADVNMDGTVKYVGAGNDRDPILVNVGGSVPTSVRQEQLP